MQRDTKRIGRSTPQFDRRGPHQLVQGRLRCAIRVPATKPVFADALRSLASPWIDAPETSPQAPETPRDEGARWEKKAVAMLKRRHGSWQRHGTRRPAPSWQSTPHSDESRGAREQLPVGGLDMEALHRLLPGKAVWKTRVFFRYIYKT